LPLRVVHVFDVGVAVLELPVRSQARARVVDRASARQREGERIAVEGGGDRWQWERVDLDGPPGADRAPRGPHQPAPPRARRRVPVGPRLHDRLYLGVAAAVVADDLAPRALRSTEPEGQLGELSELALGRGDVADRTVLLQYEVGEEAIVVERLVAGRVVGPE